MALSDGFKAIERWASSATALRTAPDDSSLTPMVDPEDGWDDSFSRDSGQTPRRSVFNWLFGVLSDAAVDVRQVGILAWDIDVDTIQGGVKQKAGVVYSAVDANGPTYTNATDPDAVGQTVWQIVSGTIGRPEAPSAPSASSPASGELEWEWECPRDGGAMISNFDFEWRPAGTLVWTLVQTARTHATLAGLTNGVSIEARVRAENSQGQSTESPVGTAAPQGTVPAGGGALALRAEPGDTEAGLDWLEPDDGGLAISDYVLQWRNGNQGFSSGRQTIVTDTVATVAGLVNGTLYYFQVRARNSAGAGAFSNEASAAPVEETADEAIPDRAVAPTGTAGQGDARWVWPAPSDNGSDITGYQFRFRETGSGSWTVRTVGAVPTRTEPGLVNGTAYEAQVRAVNGVGTQTAWSLSGTVTPAAEAPDQVQHVELDNVTAGIRATWGVPDDNGDSIDRYDVQHANNSSFTAASTVQVASGETATVAVADGQTRYVRVRAVNGAGSGVWSPAASLVRDDGMARPDAPDAPEGTPRRPLIVDWVFSPGSDNGSDLSGYEVQWRYAGDSWSGNIISGGEPFASHTVADTSTAVQARCRASNAEGTSDWSGTATVAATALEGVVAREINTSPVTVSGYSNAFVHARRVGLQIPSLIVSGGTVVKAFQCTSGGFTIVGWAITGLSDGDTITVTAYSLSIYPQPGTA